MEKETKIRSIKGLVKENQRDHQKDHAQWSRRGFLGSVGLTTSVGLLLGKLPLQAFTSAQNMDFVGDSERVLVIIRLAGGNDGLNTVVPVYDYGRYRELRPSVGLEMQDLHTFSDGLAFQKANPGLQDLWENDLLKLVQGVGYPEQNLSHFRSTDIWSSASDADEILNSGWLGRLITLDNPEVVINPPDHPSAVQIGNSGNISFNDQDSVNLSFQVSNTNQLFQIANDGTAYQIDGLPDCLFGAQSEFVRRLANETFRYADVIKQSYEGASNKVGYTASALANQLAIVSRLIKGGLRTSLYMVTLNGFDTHANQPNLHRQLLHQLSTNVKEFFDDLRADEKDGKVLAMTVSEFGRRPAQNASNGTDHGAAAPQFFMGPAIAGSGVIGSHPDLNDLDSAGNLKYQIDFRQVYQSVLTDWLCFPEMAVYELLGQQFDPLDLGFSCVASRTVSQYVPMSEIKMFTHHSRLFTFSVSLQREGFSLVRVFDLSGRVVAKIHRGFLSTGEHQFVVDAAVSGLKQGMYIFTLKSGSSIQKRKFVVS